MQVQLITLAGRGEGRQGLLAGKEQSEEGAANAEEWVTVLGLGKRQAIGAGVMVGGSGCRQLRQGVGFGPVGFGPVGFGGGGLEHVPGATRRRAWPPQLTAKKGNT